MARDRYAVCNKHGCKFDFNKRHLRPYTYHGHMAAGQQCMSPTQLASCRGSGHGLLRPTMHKHITMALLLGWWRVRIEQTAPVAPVVPVHVHVPIQRTERRR